MRSTLATLWIFFLSIHLNGKQIEGRIVQQGEVAISLEWLKISGINEDRAMKINDRVTSEYLLFNTRKKQGIIYTRWGAEGNWNIGKEGSPAMYLTVQK